MKPPNIIYLFLLPILLIVGSNYQINQDNSLESQIERKDPLIIQYGDTLKASVIPSWFNIETLGVKILTAYSSEPEQTDSTPFITASNKLVRDGIVAYNCLPFGTRIRIPELYGDKIFVVEDRMNKKWGCSRIDIWMVDTGDAKEFGVKKEMIEVLN
jgi:3D (Asp-Asp-Asp) domain-containing protein